MRRNNLFTPALIPLLAWGLLGGCASQQETAPRPKAPLDFPTSIYTDRDNGSVYKVDSAASSILVSVRRGGLMASLGHDHIVASHDLQGFILLDREDSQNPSCRADFYAQLANLEVDNAQLRAEAGFVTTPSANDIAGTTNNMLKSIEVERFPFARLHSSDCLNALAGEPSELRLTIHGVSRRQKLAVVVEEISDNRLVFSGEFSLLQSDFGIEPFAIMNGLIKVEDRIELAFKITALRLNQ